MGKRKREILMEAEASFFYLYGFSIIISALVYRNFSCNP